MSITPTYDQLEKRVKELEAKVETFKRAETACPKNEKTMQAILSAMGERVKELNCLYSISSLVEKHDSTLEEILQGTVNIIPPSWQYPEITCSRIVLEGREYGTDNFKKTNWKQSSDILVHGLRIGSLEVYYLKEMPEIDEGPFLKEERSLINAISERLGKIIERIRSERALQESEARYKILTEQVADGVALYQEGLCLFANNAFASMFGYENTSRVAGIKVVDLISNDFKKPFLKFHEDLEADDSSERIFQGKYMTNDGREFWAEAHLAKIKWNGKPAVLSTIRDVTEKKLQELELIEKGAYLEKENIKLRSSLKDRYRLGEIIGKSNAMQEVYESIIKASNSDANVIIYGESGTGKELVAKAIHNLSDRKEKEFVPINCKAIPNELIESEFFGYKKGAFSGAVADKKGYLDIADKGTLFIDEVGEIEQNMQVKLLRAIEGGGFMPLGSRKISKPDLRIVAATHRDLKDLMIKGLIREDFYYRIHIIPIYLPPLRKRIEDLPLLIGHFFEKYSDTGKIPSIPGFVMAGMLKYEWPGNIRELQNVIHRYITLGKFDIIESPQYKAIESNFAGSNTIFQMNQKLDLKTATKSFQKTYLAEILKANGGNRTRSAKDLGINLRTLQRKIQAYEISA